jgi:hypothetical protein
MAYMVLETRLNCSSTNGFNTVDKHAHRLKRKPVGKSSQNNQSECPGQRNQNKVDIFVR